MGRTTICMVARTDETACACNRCSFRANYKCSNIYSEGQNLCQHTSCSSLNKNRKLIQVSNPNRKTYQKHDALSGTCFTQNAGLGQLPKTRNLNGTKSTSRQANEISKVTTNQREKSNAQGQRATISPVKLRFVKHPSSHFPSEK